MKKASGSLLLLLTALIWGTAFVAQRFGMNFMGPYTFQSVRTLLGCLALLPVMLYRRKKLGAAFRMPSLKATFACGLPLALASTLQQIGLTTVPAGKAGFITALYVVLVPVLGILLGRRTNARTWIGVALAVVGLYLLSGVGTLSIASGEVLVIGCAILYALQILAIDHFAPTCDGVALSLCQFLVSGLLPLPFALLLEHPQLAQLWDGPLGAVLYGRILLRHRLHSADHRPNAHAAHPGQPDHEPGIGVLRGFRRAAAGRTHERQRADRQRADAGRRAAFPDRRREKGRGLRLTGGGGSIRYLLSPIKNIHKQKIYQRVNNE